MVSVEDIRVDYLGRSETGYPCFLAESGTVYMFLDCVDGFLCYNEGDISELESYKATGLGLGDTGHVMFQCGNCGTSCRESESIEADIIQEMISEDVSPRSLRVYLSKVLYGTGEENNDIEWNISITQIALCTECYNQITQAIEEVITERSEKIASYTI